MIHVESKNSSAWLLLHGELIQDIRPSPAVLISSKSREILS